MAQGALVLSVLRAMRERGFDITIAFYRSEASPYTSDPAQDFAADGKLLDMTDSPGLLGVDRLSGCVRERHIGVVLVVGAAEAYRQAPYLKERFPSLRIIDMLYNQIGHVVDHFLFEICFDGVIVESQAMRSFVLANTVKSHPSVQIVRSGVDLAYFVPSARHVSRPNPLTFGYLGRMSPEKNPMGFIEIAERLHEAIPALRFRMFGQGQLADAVRARVARGTAAAVIDFCGYAGDAIEALHSIDVLIISSQVDGRPVALMEANACGVPVIAAPVGGLPEMILEGQNGHLAGPKDHAAITRIVRGWMEDPNSFDRMRQMARMTAEAQFNRQRMLDEYAAVFAGAAAGLPSMPCRQIC
jgi:glycosyltransferase involved in cell wall biosynthesis